MPVAPWFVPVAKPVAVVTGTVDTAHQFFVAVVAATMAMTDLNNFKPPMPPMTPMTFPVTVPPVMLVRLRVSTAMNADGDIGVGRDSGGGKYQCDQSAQQMSFHLRSPVNLSKVGHRMHSAS